AVPRTTTRCVRSVPRRSGTTTCRGKLQHGSSTHVNGHRGAYGQVRRGSRNLAPTARAADRLHVRRLDQQVRHWTDRAPTPLFRPYAPRAVVTCSTVRPRPSGTEGEQPCELPVNDGPSSPQGTARAASVAGGPV